LPGPKPACAKCSALIRII